MNTPASETYIVKNSISRSYVLLRLLGSLALYICFGLIAEYGFADDSEYNPTEATQGAILLDNGNDTYINALLLQTEVEFDVSGIIARAKVRQRFRNTSDHWTEGIYIFPLPENAAVDHFTLKIGQRQIEGQIQEREQARNTYKAAKNEGRQGGLVEQQRANIFRTALANIAPGEELSVEIEYQQTLEYKDGSYRLRFPMVIGPRFHASRSSAARDNTDTDVSTSISETRINPVDLHVSLDAGAPLAELDSTYHAIDIERNGPHRYSIALAPGTVFADRDFELVWTPELSHQPQTAVFTERHEGYEYALVSVLPPDLDALGQQLLPRDVVFILDVSGSMSGTSIDQAKASLIEALRSLKSQDRFNIIWFNERTERLYPNSMPATSESIHNASMFISTLAANGGTVMLPALTLALNEQPGLSRLRQIIFLTDGNVDNEQELFDLISEHLGDNRLFTIGIGSAPNSYFMRKAARTGRGTFTHIGNIDEVEQKTNALLGKLESPAMVNIDMRAGGLELEAFPDPIPDLYLGEPLTVLIRGRKLDNSMTLYGDYGESSWQQKIDMGEGIDHPGIHTAWARKKIASLLERRHDAGTRGQRDALKNQIIDTSIEHHLVSRFTSLVAVDVTPINNSGYSYSEKMKTNLPHGWNPAQTRQPSGQHMLMAQLNLPQTATSASTHLLIASMLFSLAMILYQWRRLL